MEYQMINCKNCGEEMPLKLSKCPYCGQKNTVKACGNCGNSMSIHAHTCSTCGAKNQNDVSANRILVVVAVVVVIAAVFSVGVAANKLGLFERLKNISAMKPETSVSETTSTTVAAVATTVTTTEDKYKDVDREYTISAGNYTAGIDIPAGICDIKAISGNGNIISTNSTDGGVNEVFGLDDGTGFYTEGFSGLKLPEGESLAVSGTLRIKLIFNKVESNINTRIYDNSVSFTLASGNYNSGDEFPAGTYKIVAISGSGNISSTNMNDGGINEVMGIDTDETENNSLFLNATFTEGSKLTITDSLKVKLIPIKGA